LCRIFFIQKKVISNDEHRLENHVPKPKPSEPRLENHEPKPGEPRLVALKPTEPRLEFPRAWSLSLRLVKTLLAEPGAYALH